MKTNINSIYEKKDDSIRLIIENSEDIISIHDFEGTYLFFGGKQKYNYLSDKIIGKKPYDFYEQDIADRIVNNIKDTYLTGGKNKFETKLLLNNEYLWFQIMTFPIQENNKIVSVMKICKDITERVKNKQDVLTQKEFLNNVLNSIPHPLYVIDVETYNIVLANRATNFNEFSDFKTCYALTHNLNSPSIESGFSCPVDIIKKTKKSCVTEHIHYDKNKEKRVFEVHGFPIFDDNNNLIQVIEYNIDISEKKKLEELLFIEKEKANESNRLKTAFLKNMSHEIRTPMNAILGFGELIKNKKLEVEKRNKFIDIINNSGNYLLELIDDIIDISKIDAKQLEIVESEVKIISLVNEVYMFFISKLHNNKNKTLIVNCKIIEGEDLILIDRQRLRQILTNLISNAIKFTEKGVIEIKYSILHGKEILFEIKDTGIGISKKNIQYIFERFRQANNKTKKVYGGTGLGLAISKGFVELMGGKMSVESIERKGSVFSFTIPYNKV